MDLPFIGSEMRRGANFVSSTLIDPLEDVLGDLSNLIRLEQSKRDGEFTTVDLLQLAMYELFGEIEDATGDLIEFVAADGTALRSYDDVDVTLTDTFDDLRVGIRAMGNIFDPIDIELDVNGAVPGLPVSFASDAMIQLGMTYDMSLAFGVSYINDKLDFYIDTARENEILVEAYADLDDNASLSAALGFLDFDVNNLLKNGHKELSAALTVDLKDPNAGNTSKPELDDGRLSLIQELRGTKFKDVVDAQFTARAEVSLAFVGSFGGSTQFPRFLTDFHYSQVFADVNLTTGVKQSEFGGTPEIVLAGIRLDLGTFISNFAGPILQEVQKITQPTGEALQPVVDPLPVVSDLLGSPTSALRLIEMFGGAGVAKYTTFFRVLKGIVDLINAMPPPDDANGVMIRFGDYVVSGANRDARNPQKFDQNQISAENKGRKINPQAQATSPKLPTANVGRPTSDTSGKKASGKTKGFLSKSGALQGLRFPILNNPSTAIGLLTGASNVDLVVFDLPELYIEKSVSQDIWIWAPFLSATFGAGISATVNLSFGFDSRGLNLFRDSGWNNPEYLFFGLHARDWYDDGSERVELQIDMQITASAQIGGNFVVMSVKAGIAGGIFGTVKFDLNDVASREGTYDGKLYIDELAYIVQRDPLGLFDVSAEFRAKVWAFVEIKLSLLFTTITIFEKKQTLVDVVLWRFDYHKHFQLAPLGEVNDGILTVFTSSGADKITIHETDDGRVMVDASGDLQRFEDVTEVVIDAGAGDDYIVIADTFTRKATVRGGAGRDTLISEADAEIYFDGGAGADVLIQRGSTGAILRGGDGDDRLTGGIGDDQLYGDAGNDIIFADEPDTVFGTTDAYGIGGNDTIYGGSGNDVLYGQYGDDVIFGDAGNDLIFGQMGDDTLNAGAGRDEVLGGDGDDRILGASGVNVLAGNDGVDYIVGGTGADTIRWSVGDKADVFDGGAGRSDVVELRAAEFSRGQVAQDSVNVSTLKDGRTRVEWRDSVLELLEIRNAETIDMMFGLGQDDVVLNTPDGVADAASIVLQLGAAVAGRPGDRSTDTVRIVGSDDDDKITSTAVTADSSSYALHRKASDGSFEKLQVVTLRDTARGESEEDTLRLMTGLGDDTVDLSGQRIIANSVGGLVRVIETEGGDDTVIGSARDEIINVGAGNDEVRPGRGNDVLIDGSGRDTLVYDAAEEAGNANPVTYRLYGQQLEIEQAGDIQREYLWDFEVIRLLGTDSDDTYDIREFMARAELDGREGSDAYLGRANEGVARFGVEGFSDNTVVVDGTLDVQDGDVLVGLEVARLLLETGSGAIEDLEENKTVLRGVRSGVLATLISYSEQTGELVLRGLTGVPQHGEKFEVVGKAAVDAKTLALSVNDAAGFAAGDLLTREEQRTAGELVTTNHFISVTGSVELYVPDLDFPDFKLVEADGALAPETTLRRMLGDGSFERIGVIEAVDAPNGTLAIKLLSGLSLSAADLSSGSIFYGVGATDAVLPGNTTGLVGLSAQTEIRSVSEGDATLGLSLEGAPADNALVYASLGQEQRQIGKLASRTATEFVISVDGGEVLESGQTVEVELSPHTVMRVTSVDSQLNSLAVDLLSGTATGGEAGFAVSHNGQDVNVSVRNSDTAQEPTILTLARPDGVTLSVGDLLSEQSGGANALYRVNALGASTMELALLEGRWINGFGAAASVANVASGYDIPQRAVQTVTLEFSAVNGATRQPVAGEIWQATNADVEAVFYVSAVAGNEVTVELLSGRLGTGFLDLTLEYTAPGDSAPTQPAIGQFGLAPVGTDAPLISISVEDEAIETLSAPVELDADLSELPATPAILINSNGDSVLRVSAEGKIELLRGAPISGGVYSMAGSTTETFTLSPARIKLDDHIALAAEISLPFSSLEVESGAPLAAPQVGEIWSLSSDPETLLQVVSTDNSVLKARLLTGALPVINDTTLDQFETQRQIFGDGALGLMPLGASAPQAVISVDRAGLLAIDGTPLPVDGAGRIGDPDLWISEDGSTVVQIQDGVAVLLNGLAVDGLELFPDGDLLATPWALKSSVRVATLTGALTPAVTQSYTYQVAVEGDLSDVQTPVDAIAERLQGGDGVTLSTIDRAGHETDLDIVSVNATAGTIDIRVDGSTLSSGMGLYDLSAAAGIDLLRTDRAVLRIEREVEATGAADGVRRFVYVETAPLERSATARVFEEFANASATNPISLYTSLGQRVLITGADASKGTVTMRFAAPDFDETGAERARVAFNDMALYALSDATLISDQPVLRLISQTEGDAQAMNLTAARIAKTASGTSDLKISGLTQPLFEGLSTVLLNGTTASNLQTVTQTDLDTSKLHISVSDTGGEATTRLDLANGQTVPSLPNRSVVVNLDTAIVRLPAGFDGTFIKGQDVFMAGVSDAIGTVKVFKAGAGELHIDLHRDVLNTAEAVVGFGSRLYSQYTAQGADAHSGDLVISDPDDLKTVNKQVVWDSVDSGTDGMGFVSGDGLISEDGRTLLDVGYFGTERDEFGNPIGGSNELDLVFNRVRVPVQPFNPGDDLKLLSRTGTTYADLPVDPTDPAIGQINVGGGSLDVAFGPDGWEVKLGQDAADAFEAGLIAELKRLYPNSDSSIVDPGAFQKLVNEMAGRDGLYLSSADGKDMGRIIGWNGDQRLVTIEVLEEDRAEASLSDNYNQAFYLREAPVYRLDDIRLQAGDGETPISVTTEDIANEQAQRVSLSVPKSQIDANFPLDAAYSHVYLIDEATDALVAVAKIDKNATAASLAGASGSGNRTIIAVAEGKDNNGWDSSLTGVKVVVSEGYDQIARVSDVGSVTTAADTGIRSVVVTVDKSNALTLEYAEDGTPRFAQAIGVVGSGSDRFENLMFGRVASVAEVGETYELTVTLGQTAAAPVAGAVVRLATAERMPAFMLGDASSALIQAASSQYSAQVSLGNLSWEVDNITQTLELDDVSNLNFGDVIKGDGLSATIDAIHGNTVDVTLRRDGEIFDGLTELELNRQGDAVGANRWQIEDCLTSAPVGQI